MKKCLFFLILCLAIGLISCEERFFFPDNFPQKHFYSYLPYKKGDTLLYTNHLADTMRIEVKKIDSLYLRGQRNNSDHTKEHAAIIANLRNKELNLTVACACYDRQTFEVKLSNQPASSNIQVLGSYVYALEEMSDLIFNQFVDDITLSEGKASIQRKRGLMLFTDPKGVEWTYIDKRSKK